MREYLLDRNEKFPLHFSFFLILAQLYLFFKGDENYMSSWFREQDGFQNEELKILI